MVPVLTFVVAAVGAGTVALLVRGTGRRPRTSARVRALRARTTPRLPARLRTPLAHVLDDADVGLEPESALGWWAVAIVAASTLGLALGLFTAVLGFAGAVAAGPVVVANARARTRRRLDEAVPELLEHVAIELRGAGTVTGALVGAYTPGLRLDEIERATDLGAALPTALRTWAQRLDRDDARLAGGALGLAATVGGRAADPIDGLAASMRARLAALAEAKAQAAQARMSALVVGVAPLAFLVFSAVTDPGALRSLLGTGFGRACLAAGLTLQVLAALWIRHIVRSEP